MTASATALTSFMASVTSVQAFVHPGGMQTQADFDRMKAKVAVNESPGVDSSYTIHPNNPHYALSDIKYVGKVTPAFDYEAPVNSLTVIRVQTQQSDS